MVIKPKERLTARQALQHPWVRGKAAKCDHMEEAQAKLKQFNARRKLKVRPGFGGYVYHIQYKFC